MAMKLLLSAREKAFGVKSEESAESNRGSKGLKLQRPEPVSRLSEADQARSRMAEAAEIAIEARQRSKTLMKLPLAELTGEAKRIATLNADAEEELERLRERQRLLLESARRIEPAADSLASEHATLATQHLAEGLGQAWIAGLGAVAASWQACLTALRAAPRTSSPAGPDGTPQKSAFARVAGSESMAPPRSAARTARDGRSSPDRAYFAEAETSVQEAHSKRFLKRSATVKLSNAEEQEKLRQKRARVLEDKANKVTLEHWLWCPTHLSRQVWDLSMLALILYSVCIVPYRIGMDTRPEGFAATMELVVTILFITDLCLNFNTAYAEGQYVIIDRGMIAKNYLSGWFWIDLASSFPFEQFDTWIHTVFLSGGEEGGSNASQLKMLRALRLFRLLRLLRLLKLQQYIDAVEDNLSVNLQVLQIVKMVVGLVYLMHFLGCFWFYTAERCREGGYESTWLSNYDGGSGLTENGATVGTQYLYSIYWALTTLTTVGYGDITPANDPERWYALGSLLVGALVFGYMLSSIGDLIGSLDKEGARLQEKLDEVKEFTRWHKMDPDLATRVRKYYEYFYSRQGPLDDAEIVGLMAPALNHDVMTHLLGQTVRKIPFFYVPALGTDKGDEDAPADVQFQLAVHPLLRPFVREANETVVAKGEFDPEPHLTFLFKGQVNALASYDGGRRLYTMQETGAFLSEHVFLDVHAQVSYVAAQRCELLFLELADLTDLLNRFPHARDEFGHFALEDAITHRKQRIWSLRFVRREPWPEDPRHRMQAERHRAALSIQLMVLKRQMKRVEELVDKHQTYAVVMPALYGRRPRAQIQQLESRKLKRNASRMEAAAKDENTQQVLPFGGAFIPQNMVRPSPRAALAASAGSSSNSTEPASGKAGSSSRDGSGGRRVSSSPAPSDRNKGGAGAAVAAAAVEKLKALPEGFRILDQQMSTKEQQLAAIQQNLNLLASAVALPGGQQLPAQRAEPADAVASTASGAAAIVQNEATETLAVESADARPHADGLVSA